MKGTNKGLLKLKERVYGFLKDKKITIVIFGSRARKVERLSFFIARSDVEI